MFLLAMVFLLVIGTIWWLTTDFRSSLHQSENSEKTVSEVLGFTSKSVWAHQGDRTRVQSSVLIELLDRLGVEKQRALEALEDLGYPVDDVAPIGGADRSIFKVIHKDDNLRDALERALLVGIEIARMDDDYGSFGDEHLDPEFVARRAVEAELSLFGDEKRSLYSLYGKAALALQDMFQDEVEETNRSVISDLLYAFDSQIQLLQEEMAGSMAKIPELESLQWGDSRTRRLYYFKMGVTNTLRRTGRLDSLGHLYRYQGVNFNVEEAYDLAASECPPLVLANEIGIEKLLRMGPIEVHGLIRRTLHE